VILLHWYDFRQFFDAKPQAHRKPATPRADAVSLRRAAIRFPEKAQNALLFQKVTKQTLLNKKTNNTTHR